MLHWIIKQGGLDIIEKETRKSKLIYDIIDKSNGFYKGHAVKKTEAV